MRRFRRHHALACVFAILPALVASSPAVDGMGAGKLPPLHVHPRNDLTFADVLPGVDNTIIYTEATAAQWMVVGQSGREVDLTFSVLPIDLPGTGDQLPICFGATNAAFHNKNKVGDATPFDPNQGLTINLPSQGQLYIWLGGTVKPKGAQNPGQYQGTITLDATYTGN